MELVLGLGARSSYALIESIRLLVELFREIGAPPKSSMLGLWGELFVISRSSDPPRMVSALHSSADEHFDFSEGDARIEVKATAKDRRTHTFSHEQLHLAAERTLIVSVMTTRASGGRTIADLRDQILPSMNHDPELGAKLIRMVSRGLGRDWELGPQYRYDVAIAANRTMVFRASDLPAIHAALPPEISEVRYRVDLTECEPLDSADPDLSDGLWAAVISLARPAP
jgi:hypothetical protein